MLPKTFSISGRVINRQTRRGIANLRIEAWDKDLIFDDLIGSAITDEQGQFQMEFTEGYFQECFLDRQPDLFFKVFKQAQLIISTERTTLWHVKTAEVETTPIKHDIVIEIDLPIPDPSNESWRRVYGMVRDEYGDPLNDAIIQAFDRDIRREQRLGSTPLRAGQYEIRYQRSQFLKAEKERADLVLKVVDSDGNKLHQTPIHYNVPNEVEINLVLQDAIYKGPSEFETLTNTLMPLLEEMSPLELREDEQFQDISFLAGESGYSKLAISTWIICHRLADKTVHEQTPLEPAVFFGFMRQEQPVLSFDALVEELKNPERITLLEEKILREFADFNPELQQSRLEKAIADNLIPTRTQAKLPEILAILRKIKLHFTAETTYGAGKGTISQLLALTPKAKEKQSAFMAAFTDHTGSFNEFWDKLAENDLLSPETVPEVKLTFELGALTHNHIPLVGELKNRFQRGELKAKRELAKYNREDWQQLLKRLGSDGQPIGVPANIDGEDDAAKMEQFAFILEQRFEHFYPTTAFAAKLARTESNWAITKQSIIGFLETNPKFYLDCHRIDHYLRENEEAFHGIEKREEMITELKSIQRVFKLNPNYQTVDALLSRKIDSAQKAYFMGKEQLMTAIADSGINKIEAKKIYYKAEDTYALALTLLSDYHNAFNRLNLFAVPSLIPDMKLREQIATLPNLQTLFGSLDYCACAHCRSVYSPAAYFVDIMRFLGERHQIIKETLLKRRPDLGEIELSCENTNTPLPYIDLVNEILEDVVAPLESSAYRQTSLSAAELRANPEHTNKDAYTKLAKEIFPLNLPFDRWSIETQTYLNHLGVSQPRLFELFQQASPDQNSSGDIILSPNHLQIDCAWLSLTEIEREIITGTFSDLDTQPWNFWGLTEGNNHIPDPENPLENITGSWIDVLSHVNVMLHRSGLSYRELLQLLDMQYIQRTGTISINDNADSNAANCDTSQFQMLGLTEEILNRIYRFIRLWRKLDGAMWELDILLSERDINDSFLQDIAKMNRLRERFNLDWRILYSLYNHIDHNRYSDRSKDDNPAIQTLYQRLFRNKLVDALSVFPESPTSQLNEEITAEKILPGILAAFRIKEIELSWILNDLNLTTNDLTTADDSLSWEHLSHIYRITVLAKAVDLNIDDFLRLKRLWGANPFASPNDTWLLVQLAEKVSTSGFSILELDYLLTHHYTFDSGIALESKAIIAILQDLREGLQKISDDIRLKPEETPEAYVKSRLGFLPALAKDVDQTKAIAIIDNTWEGEPVDRDRLIEHYFVNVLDLGEAKTKLAAISTHLSPDRLQEELNQRFEYVQAALETFLLRSQQEAFICQKIAEAFQLEVPVVGKLLNQLQLSGTTNSLLQIINEVKLLQKTPAGRYEFSLDDESNFPKIFKSLRLIHQNALLIEKWQIKADELVWWLNHATEMTWISPQNLPLADNTSSIEMTLWENMHDFFHWKNQLPKSDLTAFEFLEGVLAGIPSTDSVDNLAKLTAYEVTDITRLMSAFSWKAKDFIKSSVLLRLTACMQALKRLGVNAKRAIEWANPKPTPFDAETLKQTVKAKYELTQWQQIIQPIQDEFREQKRQALMSWLITHPQKGQNWSNPNDLYSYFLINVEMSACMLTSRLKQAIASVQLFVQRCLLNLEAGIVVDIETDSKWQQWKWMQYYRVWEANRKVFLYPENWIEPELRDEKTPFFKELESELMQNDINRDTVEQAYLNYLEKLDKVANLEIRAIYNEIIDEDESVLHVFGRTRSSQSPEYYYRQRINGACWLAWEKIDLDINANHLVAGVYNRRLYLMWPQFLDKAHPPTEIPTPKANDSASIKQPDKYWEIRLFWSELKKGKWTPKVLSDCTVEVEQTFSVWKGNTNPNSDMYVNEVSYSLNKYHLQFRINFLPTIVAKLFISKLDSGSQKDLGKISLNNNEYFQKIGNQIVKILKEYNDSEVLLAPSHGTFYNGLIKQQEGAILYFNELLRSANAKNIELLDTPKSGTFTVLDSQASGLMTNGTFSIWDDYRTYIVDYAKKEDKYYIASKPHLKTTWNFQFFPHYHPFVELFIKELNIKGIKGLLNRQIQIDPANIPDSPTIFNFDDYGPTHNVTNSEMQPRPVEAVDFSYEGAYAPYNWELFFHVPFFIANKLSANQRFEEALEWFHFIFNPTSTDRPEDPDTPQQKYWITKPFYETTKAEYYQQKIENMLLSIAKGNAKLSEQINEWRNNPFNPHLIARMRTVAYQKNVLIKYIQTLIAWGDQLFRRDTIETVNEAIQLYILAAVILGSRPKSIPKQVTNSVKTFNQLEQEGIGDFGNVLKQVENLVFCHREYTFWAGNGARNDDSPELPRLDVLYFCIPNNDKLLNLWDTVADRLFKIRHCMNIEGIVRQLPLFEPPIDPALLVKATAAGLDIGTVLSDMNAPMPLYRFTFVLQRALELCNEVKSLGTALLSALEKKDAEALALLRSNHELMMMDEVKKVKENQIEEALKTWEGLKESKKLLEERKNYYQKLIDNGWNINEKLALKLSKASTILDAAIALGYIMSGGLKSIPDFLLGTAGFGGTPVVEASTGGSQAGSSAEMATRTLQAIATAFDKGAALASTVASYQRRAEEWNFQKRLAEKELPQIDKQIAAAEIRHQMMQQELANHDKQKENAQKEDDYLHSKFTNQALYDWMVNQISMVYFQSYQLAYDIAKRAERCFRYELGLSDSNYIQFGYWDSLKKGLLSGEKLYYDLKRLETAYYEQNRREYELTKHLSLAQFDPIALLKLKQNGECIFEIPETLFDMDYPSHYFRRIKTVSLSIPCVTGPYTTLACTLTLMSNRLRKNTTGDNYERDLDNDDPRFRDEIAAIQSIATSHAQNDHGQFELNFRDERYLPFEGAGAISTWRIKLNKDFPQFDFSTISDVIIHLNYTAREGGELLRSKVTTEFKEKMNKLALAENKKGLFHVFDLKREFSDKWHKFLHPTNPTDDQELVLDNLPDRLPYFTHQFDTKQVTQIEVVALAKNTGSVEGEEREEFKVMLSPLGNEEEDFLPLSLETPAQTYQGFHRALKDSIKVTLDSWILKIKEKDVGNFNSLPVDAIEELFLIINYTIA
jgi:hypothetical protein